MIISVSRRTDIPAFYAQWFMNRIRAGYCAVPNPFNPQQVSCVSLRPDDVDVIVFWTRHPKPLLPYLEELDRSGYRYYFQYTLLANPRPLETRTPSLDSALETFRLLSDHVGPDRVIWRYDPIVLSSATRVEFHIETYGRIAQALAGRTRRCVVSILDLYAKAQRRLKQLKAQGVELTDPQGPAGADLGYLLSTLARIAGESGMEIVSCAEILNLQRFGIAPGKCVDDAYIERVFGIRVSSRKDPSQRGACGCVESKDIGAYDTCVFGCQYCYATRSFDLAQANYAAHDPESPSLIGWQDCDPPNPGEQPSLPGFGSLG